MRTLFSSLSCLAAVGLALGACGSEDPSLSPVPVTTSAASSGTGGGSGGSGGAGGAAEKPEPGAEFDRFCGARDWSQTTKDATEQPLTGDYLGVLQADPPFPEGTLETVKIIPTHPFQVKTIRAAFGKGGGVARIRLMGTFGRSYPAGFPDLDSEGANLIPPIDIEVPEDADPEQWMEIDVESEGLFLLPTQHYMLVYEHLTDDAPLLAAEAIPEGEFSRTLLFVPKEDLPYGLDGNFRMELGGSEFCAIDESDRFFGEDKAAPFASDVSPYAAVSDLNGDGHDDLVVYAPGPTAYFGDGSGNFASPAFDPFPDAHDATMLVFGDIDNDGDLDAFAATYVTADSDGDGFTITGGDCDDSDAAVRPIAFDSPNGKDDDCDGIADDGTDTSDADGDGFSIAAGDCDDTAADAYPGAPEIKDARDNDCDGVVDQTFVNKILLNDGTGHFTELPNAGVEALDPSTAGAFGDANGDGFLDLYWGNWLEHYPNDKAVPDRYFTGNGDGTFTDAQTASGLDLPKPWSVYGVMWNDWNNDGAQDIFVGNYHLYDNQLWQNQGGGTFQDVALAMGVAHDETPSPYAQYPGGHTYGGDFADVDHDGDMDFYMCNLAHPRVQPWSDPSMFVENQGAPSFSFINRLQEKGFIYDEGDVNAAFADFDNDMDDDLLIASLYTGHFSRLYRNDGEKGFTDITYEAALAVHDSVSVVWSDADEDGDMDLVIADRAGAPYVHYFENRVGQDKGFIELDLEGTTANRGAIGARVSLTAGGVTQLREVSGGGGHSNTQKSHRLHFGLGSESKIDTLTVRWATGATETFTGGAPKGRYRLVEGSGVAAAE